MVWVHLKKKKNSQESVVSVEINENPSVNGNDGEQHASQGNGGEFIYEFNTDEYDGTHYHE